MVESACLNDATKHELISEIDKQVSDTNKAQILAEFIEKLPQCSVDNVSKGKKGERKLTNYNILLSACLKKEKMDSCVPKWRIVKECIKNGGTFDMCKTKVGY